MERKGMEDAPKESSSTITQISIKIEGEAVSEYMENETTSVENAYDMVCLGSTTVDRRYTACVMPWVVRQLSTENRKHRKNVQVVISPNAILVTQIISLQDGSKQRKILDTHNFDSILKLARLRSMDRSVGFLTVPVRDCASSTCHAFQTESPTMKADFLKTLRTKILEYQASGSDSPRKPSAVNIAPPRMTHRRNLSSGAVMNAAHQDTVYRFSVYYIGKVTISQPMAPPKLVDEILRDLKRLCLQEKTRDKMTSSTEETSDGEQTPGKTPINGVTEDKDGDQCTPDRDRKRSSSDGDQRKPENVTTLASNGNRFHEPSLADIQEDVKSRLVTFQISMSSLMLFNYGSKTLLLERKIRDISYCTKAEANPDHFGFVCRENSQHTLYTFQGESEHMVDNIMKGMRQAFDDAVQASAHLTLCDTCPLRDLIHLCEKLEGLLLKEQQTTIQEFVQKLSEDDYTFFMNEMNKSRPANEVEHIEVIVGLLRDIFDQKQKLHKHTQRPVVGDNNVIVGQGHVIGVEDARERSKSTFFEKAKKSLTNSFENLLTRRAKARTIPNLDDRSSPLTVDVGSQVPSAKCLSPVLVARPLLPEAADSRPRSRTFNSCPPTPTSLHGNQKFVIPEGEENKREDENNEAVKQEQQKRKAHDKKLEEAKKKPLTKHSESPELKTKRKPMRQGSWRQAIYDSVVTTTPTRTPTSADPSDELVFSAASLQKESNPREKARLRWQKAIKEQILLIRMEKENKKLAASLVATETRRLKLSYDDHSKCNGDGMLLWDKLLSDESKDRIDDHVLLKAVRTGVPKLRRGEAWQLLIHQYAIRTPDTDDEAWREPKYSDLVDEPTTHQHAILIDLGRTFPSHKYFNSQLGQGQISLFNILKAYSLLDAEVGYCQGLSFVAGLLLMHMSEKDSFECFRHIMFKLCIRNQYKPDMIAVQQQLYQLSRLLHDYLPSVYEHLNKHDVTPTLYAAPWFLTLFASQYPVGFVSRVMDLLFFQGLDVIFKVALVIIGLHTEEILECDSFESVVDYLKVTLPEKVKIKTDEIISRALDMDIKQQLNRFEVEYQLLHEEMIDIRQNRERFERQESTNRALSDQVESLKDELVKANETIKRLKHALTDAHSKNKFLELKLLMAKREREGNNTTVGPTENSFISSPVSEVERILNSDKQDGCSMEKSWEMVPSPTTVTSQMDSCLDRVRSFDENEPISRANSDECCESDEPAAVIGEQRKNTISDKGNVARSVPEVKQSPQKRRKSFPIL